MARKLLLSNGELHVGLNKFGLVHDFYFPYVGQENHAAARSLRHRIGVWVDGDFSWLDDGNWQFKFQYHDNALVGHTFAKNESLQISLEFEDCVDATQAALLRNIHIINNADRTRDIRLFMHQVFIISNSFDGDTAQYIPSEDAILHYKGHRAFVVHARHADGRPADSYSVGLFGIEGREGTYRDAEDGELSGNPVEHGRVDSVFGLSNQINAHSSTRIHYWIAAGTSQREAYKIHNRLKKNGLHHHLIHTAAYWRHWAMPATEVSKQLDKKWQQDFISSILLIKASQDKRGAVIASTDTTMLNYWRDAYGYCWPRDAMYVLWPLLRLGYRDELIRYFAFARRSLHEDGYLSHKYQADGTIGSSWHPYVHHDGIEGPPIQEDETAGSIFLLGQFVEMHKDEKLLREYYPTFVAPMANFIVGYIDPQTGLPKPSYNLWEEVYQTNTYTVALTYAGLLEAAKMADMIGKTDDAVRWRSLAEDIKTKAYDAFWNESRGYFYRGFISRHDGSREYDETVDTSSFFGAFMFGLFDANDAHMRQAFDTLRQTLLPEDTAGLVRYEYDTYNRQNPNSLGNPWPVTTLWMAQYYIEIGDFGAAMKALDWVKDRVDETGVLAEQYDPETNSVVSVAPLTWSQAEYAGTLLDLVAAMKSKKVD